MIYLLALMALAAFFYCLYRWAKMDGQDSYSGPVMAPPELQADGPGQTRTVTGYEPGTQSATLSDSDQLNPVDGRQEQNEVNDCE